MRKITTRLPTTIHVTGRRGSGKSTVIHEIRKELMHLEKEHIILEELRLNEFANSYIEGTQVLIVDTQVIICCKRVGERFKLSTKLEENQLLSFVTVLPRCTIISNDNDIDTLRVHIKKLVKKL